MHLNDSLRRMPASTLEELLAQGATLTKRGADYVTEAGGVMSWRTVKAVRERGVLL